MIDNKLKIRGARHHNLKNIDAVSYTHLRAHETREDLVCRTLLETTNIKRGLTPQHELNK